MRRHRHEDRGRDGAAAGVEHARPCKAVRPIEGESQGAHGWPAPCPRHDGDASAAAVRVPGPGCPPSPICFHPAERSDPDVLLGAFLAWVQSTGLTLYPAQEEAMLELLAGQARAAQHADRLGQVAGRASRCTSRRWPRGRRSFYTCPIKALVNEKFFALCELFGAENVGMLTGDASINRERADRLLHRRDPREPGAARGRAARRLRGDGRVPLLRRPGARRGLADPAARAAARRPSC